MTTPNDPTPTIDPIDALIASYVQAIEAGEVPNRQEWLDRHPSQAAALQTFFNDFDRMDRVASPLRMAGPDETRALDENGRILPPTVRYFGDYELLEEVARGGMGIVYKARQSSLNRLVALKMVLTGTHASPREIARFQAEAESAANLDHPNIVPVYEVGEHQGQQYFSMKFIEGTSLAAHPRASASKEVKGLITVARAVHHAHQRGVLHRDLKPSNVLIDPNGEPHVTDFGLAKRLTDIDRSLTDPGQVLGTPRYMPPEQAAGRKDLTVAADIYSLGVILYERLTGRTPFLGDNVLTLLRQVRETEPPRPSTIQPGLSRDLETIVLKCLDKEPSKRYLTAAELVEDLDRWCEGRPIHARPVGQAERFARWCRRNPAVAGLTASVAVALIFGTVVSIHFALREREAANNAKESEGVAIAARDETERAFARSLVRPLNPSGDVTVNEFLSGLEEEALWELSAQSSDTFRIRFLDEAIRDPRTLLQLRARAEPSLIAAIGLDPVRRAKASRLLADRLSHTELSLETKTEIAFILLNLEARPGPVSERASEIIIQALSVELKGEFLEGFILDALMSCLPILSNNIDINKTSIMIVSALERETDVDARSTLAWDLNKVASRLDVTEASRVCSRAARTLVSALEREADVSARGRLASYLEAVTSWLDATEAARVSRVLVSSLDRESSVDIRCILALNLGNMALRLDMVEAAGIARALTTTLAKEADARARIWLVRALVTLSRRLDTAEVVGIAHALVSTIELETDTETRSRFAPLGNDMYYDYPSDISLASALVKVSTRLDATEASRNCSQAARALVSSLERETDNKARDWLTSALAEVASQLDGAEAALVCLQAEYALVSALERKTDEQDRSTLARCLGKIAFWLDASELTRASSILMSTLQRETGALARVSLVSALVKTSARLDAVEIAGIARTLASTLEPEPNAGNRRELAWALGTLASRLDMVEAARIALDLVSALDRETDGDARRSLASALDYVSSRLDAVEVAGVARALLSALDRETDSDTQSSLASTLVDFSSRRDAAEIAGIARVLISMLERKFMAAESGSLASAMRKVSEQLESDQPIRLDQIMILAFLQTYPVSLSKLQGRFHWQGFLDLASDWQGFNSHYQFDPVRSRIVVRELAALLIENLSLNNIALLAILTDGGKKQQVERAYRLAALTFDRGIGEDTMRVAAEPYPCRLTTEDLVELLKFPTCYGEARRIVLDQLGNIHGRRFANHWEFVRFAQEKGLKLDFTSPPRRPDPKASLQRLLDALPSSP
ncbi:protein kinase domain-containing protein [Tundrisphaera lichenicola]|uniref:serine/threonine-protein kinase n=1 Tax=Tundrisphaera lichenicola TaxID=2029860 RepID=UPI003EB85A65